MADDVPESEAGDDSVRISMLIEKPLLAGIDSASGRYGVTRSAFVRQALQKALKEIAEEPDWNYLVESTKGPFFYDLAGLAKRLQHVGYLTPEGIRVLRKKIHNQEGPGEILQGLPSPYEQLLRKLGLTPRKVEEALTKGSSISLRADGEYSA